MKTSPSEINKADDFISGKLPPQEHLLTEAQLLLNRPLRFSFFLQKEVRALLMRYGRNRQKAEVNALYQRMMSSPKEEDFQRTIRQIFTD